MTLIAIGIAHCISTLGGFAIGIFVGWRLCEGDRDRAATNEILRNGYQPPGNAQLLHPEQTSGLYGTEAQH